MADHSPGIRQGLTVVRAAEEQHANAAVLVIQCPEPTVHEDGYRARRVRQDVLVDAPHCGIPLFHLAVSGLLFVERDYSEGDTLVLGDAADVLVHGGVRGHDGERLDGDGEVALLEVLKSADDLLRLGLGASVVGEGGGRPRILGVVDNEHS